MDLINRQAAIDALKPCAGVGNRALDKLRALPTADAVEVVRCRDCKYFRATDPVDTFVDGGLCTVFKDGDRYTMSYSFCFYGRRMDDHEDS